MTYERCRQCGRYTWGNCSCREYFVAAIEWDVTRDYRQGRPAGPRYLEFRSQYAEDAREAATRCVERVDQNSGEGPSGEVHVVVRTDRDDAEGQTLHVVQSELVPEYWATDDRWDYHATKAADALGLDLPEALRPQSKLPRDYHAKGRDNG